MKKILLTAQVLITQDREYEIEVPDDFPTDLCDLTDEQYELLIEKTHTTEEYVSHEETGDLEILDLDSID